MLVLEPLAEHLGAHERASCQLAAALVRPPRCYLNTTAIQAGEAPRLSSGSRKARARVESFVTLPQLGKLCNRKSQNSRMAHPSGLAINGLIVSNQASSRCDGKAESSNAARSQALVAPFGGFDCILFADSSTETALRRRPPDKSLKKSPDARPSVGFPMWPLQRQCRHKRKPRPLICLPSRQIPESSPSAQKYQRWEENSVS